MHYKSIIVSQALFFSKIEEVDDLIQIATIGAIKAFNSYLSDRGELVPYLISCIKNELITYIHKEFKHIYNKPIDDYPCQYKESFLDYIPELTNEEHDILNLKLFGCTRKEISEKLNISIALLNIKIHKLYDKIRKSNE